MRFESKLISLFDVEVQKSNVLIPTNYFIDFLEYFSLNGLEFLLIYMLDIS